MKCNACSYIRCFYKKSNAAQGSPEVRQCNFYMPQCNKCTVQSYWILYAAEPSQQPLVQDMCICAITDGSNAANCYSLAFLLLKPCIEALGCCIKKKLQETYCLHDLSKSHLTISGNKADSFSQEIDKPHWGKTLKFLIIAAHWAILPSEVRSVVT